MKYVVRPDDRKVEYAIYGADKGDPIYFQHGYMASAFLGPKDGAFDQLAKKENVKIIAASMPGFGLSSSYPLGRNRKLNEWPADVLAILDAEKVTRKCHLYGVSDGCLSIAALVDGLPRERVGNVVFSCPCTPTIIPGMNEGVDSGTAMMMRNIGKPFIGDCLGVIMKCMKTKARMTMFPDIKDALLNGDEKFPEMSEIVAQSYDHGISYSHRGLVDNFGTLTEDIHWIKKFSEKIKMGHRIAITWSIDDTITPKAMQKWWLMQISGAIEMEFETGWGHMHSSIPPDNIIRIWNFLRTGEDEEDSHAATVL